MPVPRYGIGEWYGRDLLDLTPELRKSFASAALERHEKPCPFAAGKCTKRGGVCSIRAYEQDDDGRIGGSVGSPII